MKSISAWIYYHQQSTIFLNIDRYQFHFWRSRTPAGKSLNGIGDSKKRLVNELEWVHAIWKQFHFVLLIKHFISDCNTLLVSGPYGISDYQITSSEPSSTAGAKTTSRVRLDTEEQVTPEGVKPGGWIADISSPKTLPWIQVK